LAAGRISEIQSVVRSFNHLRNQLAARTTEREAAESALRHRALHDPLTGLPNRTLFTDRLEHALARAERGTESVAVLFLDLNKFKEINDSLGHEQGDALLVAVSNRLRPCVRSSDTVARFGGDEFVALLEDIASLDEAVTVARRITAEFTVPIKLDSCEVAVTVSIGVATGAQLTSARALVHRADVAMYQAKRSGAAFEVFATRSDRGATTRFARKRRQLTFAGASSVLDVDQPTADVIHQSNRHASRIARLA
jgi:diguanylate cyclase (GGDEF)-like protein